MQAMTSDTNHHLDTRRVLQRVAHCEVRSPGMSNNHPGGDAKLVTNGFEIQDRLRHVMRAAAGTAHPARVGKPRAESVRSQCLIGQVIHASGPSRQDQHIRALAARRNVETDFFVSGDHPRLHALILPADAPNPS
ncbi:hypothetical protein GCM10027599_05170 [Yimella radicis]